MRSSPHQTTAAQAGFTLIEIVVSIVVLGIALLIVTSVLAPQARNTVDPVMDVKASELAQTFLNEALAKSYDHNSDHNGSRWRCGETIIGLTIAACSTAGELGPDGETRAQFNDVDDYITNGFISGDALLDSSENIIGNLYPNFSVAIDVVHDAAGFNGGSGTDIAKRIDVTVRVPSGNEIVFSAYRGNY
ncbi:prepilin-type N-terminal cleavage/methylation domain-containing protein [Neiella marina]|uniref:Prepilin-type N-terminal cleavage/methylation domain-containing protein n=1 Tax=Neiella holothuriorum TaxID=2870530 RepID=A0ABS7EC74_9GAMM|nr:prepilin-type N-terminal cleavage/methylation domain-containing protein [Neiella holothuriorum]MBW8189446.1 prepilin-type N-terminal cleavage/methylation domain-containing protein [Neiella holothuriorum]